MPRQQPFVVRRSRIHGRGAFALRGIRAGQRVGEYVGRRMTLAQADELQAGTDGHTMLFEVGRDEVLDGSRGGNDTRWINHSCRPNCEVDIRGGRVWIVARRAIEAGEELTYDYGLLVDGPYHASWRTLYRCACGAPRCRGTMLHLRPQNRVGRAYERWVAARRARRPARQPAKTGLVASASA